MSTSRSPALVLPGTDGWEAWLPGEEGAWQRAETKGAAAENPWDHPVAKKSAWALGLSCSQIDLLAMKLPAMAEGDPGEVIPLRLEAAGWDVGDDSSRRIDWKEVPARGPGHQFLAWGMEGDPLDGCPPGRVPERVIPDFLCRGWPSEAIVLWQEQGRWMLAVTGDGQPVHVQPAPAFAGGEEFAREIRGQVQALTLRGMVSEPREVVVAGGMQEDVRAATDVIGLPVREIEALEVVGSLPGSRLLPTQIVEARRARIEAGKWKRRIALIAALWFIFAGWVGWRYYQAEQEYLAAKAAAQSIAPQAAEITQVSDSLSEILALNSVDAFPLEILVKVSQARTTPDLRLTSFIVEGDGDVFIKGTARQVPLALRFTQNVQKNNNLGNIAWDTSYPRQERDGTASFNLSGKRRGIGP